MLQLTLRGTTGQGLGTTKKKSAPEPKKKDTNHTLKRGREREQQQHRRRRNLNSLTEKGYLRGYSGGEWKRKNPIWEGRGRKVIAEGKVGNPSHDGSGDQAVGKMLREAT